MRPKKWKIYDDQLEREIKKAVAKFSEHHMSNSKWVRLINALVENIDLIKKIKVKKVQSEIIGKLHIDKDTTYGFDYWQNGFEGRNSFGGWLTYKEIEYLIFPKHIEDEINTEQDLKALVSIIESIGQFPIIVDEKEIKLVCYTR